MNENLTGLKLSPAVRTVLTIVAIVSAAVVTGLTAEGTIPGELAVAINAFNAVLGYLGIVPPQVGGTQHGVVDPAVKDVPPSDNIVPRDGERGAVANGTLIVLGVALAAFLIGWAVAGIIVGLAAALVGALVAAIAT